MGSGARCWELKAGMKGLGAGCWELRAGIWGWVLRTTAF
jgi:hypothetical protein